MGNTCGTCAYDNRGSEVDMKPGNTKAGMVNNPKTGTENPNNYAQEQFEGQQQEVNLDDTQEFLNPPEYDCNAVMVSPR